VYLDGFNYIERVTISSGNFQSIENSCISLAVIIWRLYFINQFKLYFYPNDLFIDLLRQYSSFIGSITSFVGLAIHVDLLWRNKFAAPCCVKFNVELR